jgi:hypothetical protein
MAFDDGTPLDAAKLQALETELFNLRSSIPKVGSSTTINVENKAIYQSQIIGGLSDVVYLSRGSEVQFSIPFKAESNPISVVLTPFKSTGDFKKGDVSYYVTAASNTGATVRAFLSSSSTAATVGVKFYYMVISA